MVKEREADEFVHAVTDVRGNDAFLGHILERGVGLGEERVMLK